MILFQTQKLSLFFSTTQSEKHTSAKFVRFKSLYKVCLLGSPAAVVWEVPWVHWGFLKFFLILEHVVCSLISSLKKKYQEKQFETASCLCSIATDLGAVSFVSHFGSRSCFRRFCSREKKVTSGSISLTALGTTCSRIWPRLTTAVDDPDSLLPPATGLCEHRVPATYGIICLSGVSAVGWVLMKSTVCRTDVFRITFPRFPRSPTETWHVQHCHRCCTF